MLLKDHSETEKRHINHDQQHITWQKVRSKTILNLAQKNNLIEIENKIISLNEKGDAFTTKAIEYIITNEDALIEDMKEDYFLFRG